jgi:hypothetical protein
MMRRPAFVLLTSAVLLLLLVSAGCYTVIKHPTGSNVVQHDSFYRSCADCHADASYYHPYGHPYYSYGRSHYGWSGYYGYPWWYDDYWWWDYGDSDSGGDAPPVETGKRHLWSSDGWASGGWGFRKPPTGETASPPPAPEAEKKDDEKKQDEKKDDDGKHLWKPRKKGF